MNLPPVVVDFANRHAARYARTEHDGTHPGRDLRDPALIRAVIEALCDGACPWAAGVLDYVDRRRAGMEPR